MSRWPSRRLLVLSVALVTVGSALLVVQDLGTFNSTTCVHDPPSPDLCYQNPDPWPLFFGIAIAVGGLGLLLAGVVAAIRHPGGGARAADDQGGQGHPEPAERKDAPPHNERTEVIEGAP